MKYNPIEDNLTFHEKETFKGNKKDERTNASNGITENEGSSRTSGNNASTSSSNSSGLTINNDTPQGQIDKNNILNGSYASSTTANENENTINDNTSSSSSNSQENSETRTNNETSSGNQNEEFEREKSGYDLKMTNADKILNYRKTIENYYLQIIEELNPLFFALY